MRALLPLLALPLACAGCMAGAAAAPAPASAASPPAELPPEPPAAAPAPMPMNPPPPAAPPVEVQGALLGDPTNDGDAMGGLGLRGGGGGGRGEGIGLGGLGTLGHGAGTGLEHGGGGGAAAAPGEAVGRISRASTGEAFGALDASVIRGVVRDHQGAYQGCYKAGLKTNPALGGDVQVHFVIGKDGRVTEASNVGGTLADKKVGACVVRVFQALRFPPPNGGGIVTVTYPMRFAPAGDPSDDGAPAPAEPRSP